MLRWHPVWINAPGRLGKRVGWAPCRIVPDADLPPFAGACLATWRQPAEWTAPGLVKRLAEFERKRNLMQWVTRPAAEQDQPWWMTLLRPIM